MKKLIFVLMLVSSLGIINAQPIVLRFDGEDISNSYVERRALPGEEEMMTYIFDVCNESGQDLLLDVKKIVTKEVEGTMNSFCFGTNCFAPTTMEVNDLPMAKDTTCKFICDYFGANMEGVTVVRYEFTANDETVFLNVSYIIGDFQGIEDAPLENVKASIYPNPVASTSICQCTLPSNVSGSLLVYSYTGQKIKEYALTPGENRVSINAQDFNSGLYLCSVIVNGQVVSTNKMVVK